MLSPTDSEVQTFPVVGRCEAGEGVEIRRGDEPLDLAGWEHFAG